MKIKTKLNGDIQWSMLKFKTVETLDTAFYECRAANEVETIKSQAIITVDLAKGNSNSRNSNNNFFENDDLGLLPESYSEPDMQFGNVEFEGGQKPSDFGNRFNQPSKPPKNDLR